MDDNLLNNTVVDYDVQLPEAEFDIMQIIWKYSGECEIGTAFLMDEIGTERGWKLPTLISFLTRLEKRGYICSEKRGKMRYYTPLANKEEYIHSITMRFIDKYHDGSFISVLDSLYRNRKFDNNEVDELLDWLKKKYL